MVNRIAFQSAALQGAAYDPETQELTVTFRNGQSYRYQGVPQGVFEQFREAASPGTFYFQNIKGVY